MSQHRISLAESIYIMVLFFLPFPLSFLLVFIQRTTAQSAAPLVGFQGNPTAFFVAFAIATIIAFFFVKRFSSHRFWQVFFGIGAFAGVWLTLMTFLSFSSPMVAVAFATIGALLFLLARTLTDRIWLHNLVVLLAVAGVARLVGAQFPPKSMMLILVVLAFYDVIAVFFSKHMVTMARTLFEKQAFLGFIIPPKLSDWMQRSSVVKPGQEGMLLGAGDVVLPLCFAISSLVYQGEVHFWIITAFTIVGAGLFSLLVKQRKLQRPLPALPPLVLFSLLGSLISSVIR